MSHEFRARRGNLDPLGHVVKSLAAVSRSQEAQLRQLDNLTARLSSAVNGCGCGGNCTVCRLDRAKPVVDELFALARRGTELSRRLDTAHDLRRLVADVARVCGTKSLNANHHEYEIERALEAVKRRHDELLEQLCNPETGLDPSHTLCEGYCPNPKE